MYFFVKVRVDRAKLAEFGTKLRGGAITTHPLSTYCLQDDPSVGVNIWEAADRADFETQFSQHREYYSEILEISPLLTTPEAMRILMS